MTRRSTLRHDRHRHSRLRPGRNLRGAATLTDHERPGPSRPGRGYFEDMRLRLPVSALIALAPAALAAQQPTAPPPTVEPPAAARTVIAGTGVIPLDRVVAVVGNVIITQSNLRERL